MPDAHEPPLETTQESIEAEGESPLILAIKNFRDRFFSDKKEKEKTPKTDGELIEKLKVRYGFEITPQELSEIRRSANGIGLVENTQILEFVKVVPKILFDLDEIHRIEKSRAEKLKDPLKLKRWQSQVNNEIEWVLATYAARYTAKQNPNYNTAIDEKLVLRLRDDEVDAQSVETKIPAVAARQEQKSNVIRMVDHPHRPIPIAPSGKPETDGPVPVQPKTNIA